MSWLVFLCVRLEDKNMKNMHFVAENRIVCDLLFSLPTA